MCIQCLKNILCVKHKIDHKNNQKHNFLFKLAHSKINDLLLKFIEINDDLKIKLC